MAQEKPVTPEKQLLKLIEKPRTQGSIQVATVKRYGLSFFSFGALKARFSFLKSGFKKGLGKDVAHQLLDVRNLNRVAQILVFILLVYLVTNVASSMINSKKRLEGLTVKVEKGDESAISLASPLLKEISAYLEKARARDIFKMYYKKPAEAKDGEGPVSSRAIEATKHLKLVGISWSKDPDAMVEDTKAVRTFFVKRGQKIGEIKVQAIFKDKVILSFEGEEVELK